MANLFQSGLNWLAKTFSKDTSKMLIATGVAGWALSSLAQIMAILVNPKIKDEQKLFLLPQEISDAIVNIGSFFVITQFTKKTVAKLFTTGKFAPKNVREFLDKNKDLYGDKVGKLDFDLGKTLQYESPVLKKSYHNVKNLGTTIATVGAGIIASNIVTPILRNKMAANVQKSFINDTQEEKKPNVKKIPAPQISTVRNSGSMKI